MKENIIKFTVVVAAVLFAMWLSTKLKMNSFDEFEQVN